MRELFNHICSLLGQNSHRRISEEENLSFFSPRNLVSLRDVDQSIYRQTKRTCDILLLFLFFIFLAGWGRTCDHQLTLFQIYIILEIQFQEPLELFIHSLLLLLLLPNLKLFSFILHKMLETTLVEKHSWWGAVALLRP